MALRLLVAPGRLTGAAGPGAADTVFRDGLPMLDREKVVTILRRRFPGSAIEQVAAAANALVGLDDEWDELTVADMHPCGDACCLAADSVRDGLFKVLKKRSADGPD